MTDLLRGLRRRVRELNVRRMSAALALYLLMSFAPLLVVAIGLAGLVIGPGVAEAEVLGELQELVGPARTNAIANAIEAASEPAASTQATILGLLVLLWSGSRLLFELERDLEEIWDRPHAQRSPGWRAALRTIRRRLVSMALLLGMGLVLLAALLLRAAFGAFGQLLSPVFPNAVDLSALSHDLWLLAVISLVLSLLYRLLPDPNPRWRAALSGGLAAGGALTVGLLALSRLLGLSGDRAILAAAISPLLGLGGLYLAGMVFFAGAILARELDGTPDR